jgi:hypothetical protein
MSYDTKAGSDARLDEVEPFRPKQLPDLFRERLAFPRHRLRALRQPPLPARHRQAHPAQGGLLLRREAGLEGDADRGVAVPARVEGDERLAVLELEALHDHVEHDLAREGAVRRWRVGRCGWKDGDVEGVHGKGAVVG